MIRNIIYDFGGVLYAIDYLRCFNSFDAINMGSVQQAFTKASQTELFRDMEVGAIKDEDFPIMLNAYLQANGDKQQIVDAWNSLLVGFHEMNIKLVMQSRKHYRTFILSNTNSIHYQFYSKQFSDLYQINLDDVVDAAYWSHRHAARKPDVGFYKMLLHEQNLNPSETIFIDDSPQNLPPAEALGIKTLLLNKIGDLGKYFTSSGLLKEDLI